MVEMERQSRVTVEGRGSIAIFIVTIILIVLIVVAGICVSILVERQLANIILCVLIGVLLLVGLFSFLLIRMLNNRVLQRREIARQERPFRRVEATAPPMSTRTSWALKKPWRYSNRTTIPTSPNNNHHNQYA